MKIFAKPVGSRLTSAARTLLTALGLKFILKSSSHLEYSGPYATWQEAQQSSVGYDSPFALSKVRAALLDVLNGKKKYERDGTSFDQIPTPYTVRDKLSKLLTPSSIVVDFGGGLGGTYVNNRDIIDGKCQEYIVIEQKSFCDEGKKIANDFALPVHFVESPQELQLKDVDIVIVSSVLHYINDWKGIVDQLLALNPRHIIVDRQPFTEGNTLIFVQENEGYYEEKVSYPARIINQTEFLSAFQGYVPIETWTSDFDPPDHLGFHLVPTLKTAD
jgi:putative methyltransferase (TIGR04325 family)